MITGFFLTLLISLPVYLLSAAMVPFQAFEGVVAIGDTFYWVFYNAYKWNWLLPVDEILQVFIVLLGFMTMVGVILTMRYFINIVRGSGA